MRPNRQGSEPLDQVHHYAGSRTGTSSSECPPALPLYLLLQFFQYFDEWDVGVQSLCDTSFFLAVWQQLYECRGDRTRALCGTRAVFYTSVRFPFVFGDYACRNCRLRIKMSGDRRRTRMSCVIKRCERFIIT